jgi:hypothetical protein
MSLDDNDAFVGDSDDFGLVSSLSSSLSYVSSSFVSFTLCLSSDSVFLFLVLPLVVVSSSTVAVAFKRLAGGGGGFVLIADAAERFFYCQ